MPKVLRFVAVLPPFSYLTDCGLRSWCSDPFEGEIAELFSVVNCP